MNIRTISAWLDSLPGMKIRGFVVTTAHVSIGPAKDGETEGEIEVFFEGPSGSAIANAIKAIKYDVPQSAYWTFRNENELAKAMANLPIADFKFDDE